MVSTTRVNERIVGIKLNITGILVSILSVYLLQAVREGNWKLINLLYNELYDIEDIYSEKVLASGDLKVHTGLKLIGYEETHKGYSFGLRNSEGKKLEKYIQYANTVINKSMIKK